MFFKGTTPVTPSLPYEWHDTPNLHFLSVSDFVTYCHRRHIKVKKSAFTGKTKRVTLLPNVFAQVGIFLLSNGEGIHTAGRSGK
jgi:methionine biosynthesis protein MetW